MMMSLDASTTGIHRLPVDSEEHFFEDWRIWYKQSHILHSQCSKNGKCSTLEDKCQFCLYSSILVDLPHLPDMVFPNNILKLEHQNKAKIEFNPLDALLVVNNARLNITVACSEAWKETRQEALSMEKIKSFDWTFISDYRGTLTGINVEQTTERIDLNKLRKKEQILFYHELTLFEDELHDNGIAVMSVKIRVMPSSYFVLLRYFLRVDNVMLLINDTRYFFEKGSNYILREFTSREAKVSDLQVPPCLFTEPSEIAQHLPLTYESCEKLIFLDENQTATSTSKPH